MNPGLVIVGLFVTFVAVVLVVELVERRYGADRWRNLDALDVAEPQPTVPAPATPKQQPYRNPARRARLAKSGRLRRDLPPDGA